jgi:hypothetical protein
MTPETRHSYLQISLMVSLAASLLFAFGSYGTFSVFVCWNKCTDLVDVPGTLAILAPIVVGPFLANLAAILDCKLGREIKTWKLIVIMLGGAGIFYFIGATTINWLLWGDANDFRTIETKLWHLGVFLLGITMILPLIISLMQRYRRVLETD